MLTATDQTPQKSLKKINVNYTNIDIQAMFVLLTLPFYDYSGFRFVAVNSVYKLQFFTLIPLTVNKQVQKCKSLIT